MSTTARPPTDQDADIAVDPADAFDEVAFENPEVCSGCFAEVREIYDLKRGPDTPDIAPTQDRRRTGDGEHGWIRLEDGAARTHEPRTYCGRCGSQSGRADDQTLSRREALHRCEQLHRRLVEAGLESHLPTLKQYVRVAKSRERYEAFDTEIYRWAVRGTIRHVRQSR